MVLIPTVRSLLTPPGLADPYAVYDQFRAAQAAGADIGRVVVSHAEVAAALSDRSLSSDRVSGILKPLDPSTRAACPLVERTLGDIIAFRDPPDHTRVRTLMSKTFTPKMIRNQTAVIERCLDRLADEFRRSGNDDLHGAVTFPLPAMVIGSMLGIPEADWDRFKSWALDIVFIVGSGNPTADLAHSANEHFAEMRHYLGALVAKRRAEPEDDLLSALIAAADHHDHLTEDEIFANATFLMTAGHETATNMLSNGVLTFLRHPDQLALLRRDPSLVGNAVEEILRYEAPVQMTPRYAVDDITFAGRQISSGSALLLFLGAANRDPDVWDEPSRFDITRHDNRHQSFGFGPHFCLGAALAREEMRVILTRLFDLLPGLSLAGDEIQWQPTIDFRGPTELRVAWEGQ